MGQDFLNISAIYLFKNTPNIIPMLFPLCKVVFVCSGIVQMCTSCPGTLSRRAGTISTPLYIYLLRDFLSKGMANFCLRSFHKILRH